MPSCLGSILHPVLRRRLLSKPRNVFRKLTWHHHTCAQSHATIQDRAAQTNRPSVRGVGLRREWLHRLCYGSNELCGELLLQRLSQEAHRDVGIATAGLFVSFLSMTPNGTLRWAPLSGTISARGYLKVTDARFSCPLLTTFCFRCHGEDIVLSESTNRRVGN